MRCLARLLGRTIDLSHQPSPNSAALQMSASSTLRHGLLTRMAAAAAITIVLGALPAASVVAVVYPPPTMTNQSVSPNPAAYGLPVTISATVTDPSGVAWAQFSLDGGKWLDLSPSDGSFDETTEAVSRSIGHAVSQVAAGDFHTCALQVDTTVRCWGSNNDDQLGNGGATSYGPVPVEGLSGATAVATGTTYSCAILADATLRCWGHVPGDASGLTGVRAIAAGRRHACALLADTTVRCWGYGTDGQLGDGISYGSLTPVVVAGLSGVRQIAVGDSYSCALLVDTTVRCWGWNGDGELGDGTTESRWTPTPIPGLSGVAALAPLAPGAVHTCALLVDTTVRCWGSNRRGQLGDGTTTNRSSPTLVPGLSNVVAVADGGYHTCALLADTSVRCWGSNGNGQLGDGTTTTRLGPTPVLDLTGVAQLATGLSHSCALLADTTVRCWGSGTLTGDYGPYSDDRLSPVPVPTIGPLPIGFHYVCFMAGGRVPSLPDGTACATFAVDTGTETPTTMTYSGPTTATPGAAITVSATLKTSGGAPLAGKTVDFTYLGWTTSTTTTGAGVVSFNTAAPYSPGPFPLVVAFAGDASYAASGAVVTLHVKAPTALTYKGPTTASPAAAITLSATLKTSSGTALPGETVTFTLAGVTTSATTNGTGVASVTRAAPSTTGTYSIAVAFAGDTTYGAATKTATLVVRSVTKLTYTGPTTAVRGAAISLSATLKTSAGAAVAGKSVTFKLNNKTFTATTNSAGVAIVATNAPTTVATYTIAVAFAGDTGYVKTSASAKLKVS
jgi:alpha-tubulin suppressor-like RCC1 family protein